MIIGLTGLTGAGKSTAAGILEKKGFYIIDGDSVGHEITSRPDVLAKIKAAFGGGVIRFDGSLDRRALGRIVFSDKEQLKKLNSITHPPLREEVLKIAKAQSKPVVLDGAVLKECGLTEYCVAVIRVTAPIQVRLSRIMERDSLSREEALSRINAQTEHCDDWIDVDNSSDEENLEYNLMEALWEINLRPRS